MTKRRVRRLGLPAVLAAGLIAAASVFALGTARSAPARAFAAAIDVTQTCTPRVKPKAQVDIQAVVANTGDVQLTIAAGADRDQRRRGDAARRDRRFRPDPRQWRRERKRVPRRGRALDVHRLVHRRDGGHDRHRRRRRPGGRRRGCQRPGQLRHGRHPDATAGRDRRRAEGQRQGARQAAGRQVRPAHRPDRDQGRLGGRHDARHDQVDRGPRRRQDEQRELQRRAVQDPAVACAQRVHDPRPPGRELRRLQGQPRAERVQRRREEEAPGAPALGQRQGPLHDEGAATARRPCAERTGSSRTAATER